MKNILLGLIVLAFTFNSCSNKKEGNFIVNTKIIGLKKGTIYLEKIENKKFIVLDSLYINNAKEEFSLNAQIKEADIYIISLNKSNEQHISFFAEPGVVNISTTLKDFNFNAKISGSEQQKLLEKHDEYTKRINDRNLDLIKEQFDAQKQNNILRSEEIEVKRNNNLKRSYLFSANYAIANKNKAIAPFIAYTRMPNATPALKQKIYDSLTSDIKESKYGKLLKESLN